MIGIFITAAFFAPKNDTGGVRSYFQNRPAPISTPLHQMPARYRDALRQFKVAVGARFGWDGAESPVPNVTAERWARWFLETMYESVDRALPASVSPIIDGGLGLIYTNGNSRAILEFYNDDGVVALLKRQTVRGTREIPRCNRALIEQLAGEVRDFLRHA